MLFLDCHKMKSYGFDKKGTRRIIKSTRYIERHFRDSRLKEKLPRRHSEADRWIQITEHIEEGKYKWKALNLGVTSASTDDDYPQYDSEEENYAYEINGFDGVPDDSKVYGYLAFEHGVFVFEYNGGVLTGTASADLTGRGTATVSTSAGDLEVYNPYSAEISDGDTVTVGYDKYETRWVLLGADCD